MRRFTGWRRRGCKEGGREGRRKEEGGREKSRENVKNRLFLGHMAYVMEGGEGKQQSNKSKNNQTNRGEG